MYRHKLIHLHRPFKYLEIEKQNELNKKERRNLQQHGRGLLQTLPTSERGRDALCRGPTPHPTDDANASVVSNPSGAQKKEDNNQPDHFKEEQTKETRKR